MEIQRKPIVVQEGDNSLIEAVVKVLGEFSGQIPTTSAIRRRTIFTPGGTVGSDMYILYPQGTASVENMVEKDIRRLDGTREVVKVYAHHSLYDGEGTDDGVMALWNEAQRNKGKDDAVIREALVRRAASLRPIQNIAE